MPQFDLNAAPSGLAAGRQIPNRNTGLADVIKSITNDLRAAAASRQEQALKAQEQQNKLRETNADMFKTMITARYRLKPGASAEDFLMTGDTSMFDPPQSPFSGSAPGGASNMLGGYRPKGVTVNPQGEASYTYEAGYSEPEAGVMSKADFLVPELDKLVSLIENKKVYEGPGVPFGASRISAFGEKGPWQAVKRGFTGGVGREAGLLLQDIKVLAFGEGGKTLSENERSTALALINPQYKTEEQWVQGLKQAKALLLRKAELMSGQSYGAQTPYAPDSQDQQAFAWAKANSSDPRAQEIMATLRAKYPGQI